MTGARENGSGDPHLDLVNVCLTVPGLMGEVTPPRAAHILLTRARLLIRAVSAAMSPRKICPPGTWNGTLEKRYVHLIAPGTSERHLVRKENLCRGDGVKGLR